MDNLKADGCSPGYFRLIRCLSCNSICPDNGEDWSNCELQCPEVYDSQFMTSSAAPTITQQNLTMTTEPQGHVRQLVRSFLEAAWYIPVTHVLPPFVIVTLVLGLSILVLYKKAPRARRCFLDLIIVFKRCGNRVSPPEGEDVCDGSVHLPFRPCTLPGMSSVVTRDQVMSSCSSIANSSQTCVVYLPQPTQDAPAMTQIQHTAEVHASLGTLYPTQEVGNATQHGIIANNHNHIGYPMLTTANLPVQAHVAGQMGQYYGHFIQSENRNQSQPTSNQLDTFKMETGRRSFDRLPM